MTGFEPLITAATGALAKLVSETLYEGGEKLFKIFNANHKRILVLASGKYIQNYTARHGIMKVLGMHQPVNLESIYTPIRFLDEKEPHSYSSVEDLEKLYIQQKSRLQFRSSSAQAGMETVNSNQYLMILGDPGSGKSTFLRKMGLEAFKISKSIPVFIELKVFSIKEVNIESRIAEEFAICGFPNPEETTRKFLQNGKLLILLDGLDEVVTSNLPIVVEVIQNFVDQYPQNRYIISCRIPAYRYNLRRFRDVTVAGFNNEQIQQFIQNWFQSEEDKKLGTAQKCWNLLQKQENIAAKELAHTPLLLTFLCLVYNYSQNFPDSRSALYRKALRILLEEWAAEKRIMQEKIYQGLNTELEEVLLSEIAYAGFKEKHLFFYESDIVDRIKIFYETNLNAPKSLSGESVLEAITIQQGILVERAEGVYSFSHLTLQEYLTAKHIYNHSQIKQLVLEHLTDRHWREVFLLVAGLMRALGADELLLEIDQAIRQYVHVPKLKELLQWSEQKTTT